MNLSRSPAVAGQFYSSSPHMLCREIDQCMTAAESVLPVNTKPLHQPKALIVPHAGYIYSGVVAASAYTCLHPFRERIKKVVLIGPSHHYGFNGIATSHYMSFETPLGLVELDRMSTKSIERLNYVQPLDQAHHYEHSLEVQLPFLQQVIPDFELIPLVVGDASKDQVAEVLELLWGSSETLLVISSDLSHFLDYEAANDKDSKTAAAIETLQPDLIGYDDACGRNPIQGLLYSALKHDLTPHRIALCNSGDTAGDKDRVVGYGAWYFS